MHRPSFGTIVDRHFERIARALGPGEASAPTVPLLSHELDPALLPGGLTRMLNDRNIALCDAALPAVTYYVYTAENAALPFSYHGTLQPAQGDDFVSAAYRALLGRLPDMQGYDNYRRLLREGQLDAAGLLTSLASSHEARGRAGTVLVVPDSSAWLCRMPERPPVLVIVPEPKP